MSSMSEVDSNPSLREILGTKSSDNVTLQLFTECFENPWSVAFPLSGQCEENKISFSVADLKISPCRG